MARERGERKILKVTLSVVCLISNHDNQRLMLVQDTETGKWSPPAGGLKWLDSEGRMETVMEALEREVREETGVSVYKPELLAIVNLPSEEKNRIGAIYSYDLGLNEDQKEYLPEDEEEVSGIKFYEDWELLRLIDQDLVRKPEFNIGLIMWWIRNECRESWDPYRGRVPKDDGTVLDERYLQKWAASHLEK